MKKRWQDFYIGIECEHHQIWIDTDNGNVFCDEELVTNTSESNWENEIEDYKLRFTGKGVIYEYEKSNIRM